MRGPRWTRWPESAPPVSAAQRFKTVALRAVADDLFQIAMALMKARAKSNLKS
jgi:hypothetical protein